MFVAGQTIAGVSSGRMNPAVMATEGWIWARAAQRRFGAARSPATGTVEEADRCADLAQGLEGLDRALRYADQVLKVVSGTALPSGVEWESIRAFARRGRNAVAHGDERLAASGSGYSLVIKNDVVQLRGKARREKEWRSDQESVEELADAIDVLTAWLERESAIV